MWDFGLTPLYFVHTAQILSILRCAKVFRVGTVTSPDIRNLT
jgi:hypothetical protein